MNNNHCFWFGHDFGPWEIKEEGEISRFKSKVRIGNYLIQKRVCKVCRFFEFNMQKCDLQDL